MYCKQLDYIDGNVTRYDSERFVPERLVMEVNMLNTVDSNTRLEVLSDEIRRHRTIARRPETGMDHNHTASRASRFRQVLEQQSGRDRM